MFGKVDIIDMNRLGGSALINDEYGHQRSARIVSLGGKDCIEYKDASGFGTTRREIQNSNMFSSQGGYKLF